MSGWQWQQTMLRIKDPVASVDYYTKNYGMTLLAKCDFPQWEFALYFLATLPEGTTYDLDPNSEEAQEYLWKGEYNGHKNVALELTHNYGTESTEGPVYHGGNAGECEELGKGGRDGFGHIAFNCDDVYAACAGLEANGVTFKKKPDEGMMKGLAFAYDPDGYWVEIVSRAGAEGHGITNQFNLSQTMMRIKDPAKTIPFYEACGLTLLRKMSHERGKFTNFFMASLTPELKEAYTAAVGEEGAEGEKAVAFVKSLFIPVLELTHNWGTEDDAEFKHYSGNEARPGCGSDGRGFGHIGFLVDDVYAACDALEPLGFGFKKKVRRSLPYVITVHAWHRAPKRAHANMCAEVKRLAVCVVACLKPDEGGMKGLAFAYDPDGYWVEIVKRGGL